MTIVQHGGPHECPAMQLGTALRLVYVPTMKTGGNTPGWWILENDEYEFDAVVFCPWCGGRLP